MADQPIANHIANNFVTNGDDEESTETDDDRPLNRSPIPQGITKFNGSPSPEATESAAQATTPG